MNREMKVYFAKGNNERKNFQDRGSRGRPFGDRGGYQGGNYDGPRRDFGDRPKGCFNCGKEGHFAKDCPERNKSFIKPENQENLTVEKENPSIEEMIEEATIAETEITKVEVVAMEMDTGVIEEEETEKVKEVGTVTKMMTEEATEEEIGTGETKEEGETTAAAGGTRTVEATRTGGVDTKSQGEEAAQVAAAEVVEMTAKEEEELLAPNQTAAIDLTP